MQIAEVAYREGEVGILELLDAVRTASRARIRAHRPAARRAPGADRPGTRSGRHPVALKHLVCSTRAHRLSCRRLQSFASPPQPRRKSPKRSASRAGPTRRSCLPSIRRSPSAQTSRFAIHLTRLDTFKAADRRAASKCSCEGGAAQPEVFRVDGPSRPGIFGVDVKPAHAGKRELVIVLQRGRTERRASRRARSTCTRTPRRRARRRAGGARRRRASAS